MNIISNSRQTPATENYSTQPKATSSYNGTLGNRSRYSANNYQSLLELISSLIALLKGNKNENNSTGRTITGSNRDEVLKGTANDDIFKGRGGADNLSGLAGNDRLLGGRGDDKLDGGEGDDLLIDEKGSNLLDGGLGNDTAKFSGKLSDYEITPYDIDSSRNNFRITNQRTGDIQTLLNIENYQFKDQTLTAAQLRASIEPPALKLDLAQDQAIRDHFNVPNNFGLSVLDSDRDKTLSAGDILVLTGGITGGEISRQEITAADVGVINGSGNQDAREAYDANRQKWQDSNIRDYSFTLQRSCFCTPDVTRPVNISIENGKLVDASYADTAEPLSDTAQQINQLKVNDLFKQIGEALDSNAERVDVTYDKQYGFPTSVYIDRDSRLADEEVGFNISNFQRDDPVFTTLAVGEEDGGGIGYPIPPQPEPPIATTLALGEEDGGYDPLPPQPQPPILTTHAIGEEDSGNPEPVKPPVEPPVATTKALGEEDGGIDIPVIKPLPDKDLPIFTTQALGEEDGDTGSLNIQVAPAILTTDSKNK